MNTELKLVATSMMGLTTSWPLSSVKCIRHAWQRFDGQLEPAVIIYFNNQHTATLPALEWKLEFKERNTL